MEYATFKKWLAERGCRFDTQPEERGEGHGTVTIHREGRTAELLLVGARHELDPRRFPLTGHEVADLEHTVASCDHEHLLSLLYVEGVRAWEIANA